MLKKTWIMRVIDRSLLVLTALVLFVGFFGYLIWKSKSGIKIDKTWFEFGLGSFIYVVLSFSLAKVFIDNMRGRIYGILVLSFIQLSIIGLVFIILYYFLNQIRSWPYFHPQEIIIIYVGLAFLTADRFSSFLIKSNLIEDHYDESEPDVKDRESDDSHGF